MWPYVEQRDFLDVSKLRILRWRSPKSNEKCPYKSYTGEIDRQKRKRQCEHGGRGWGGGATSPGAPEGTRSWRGKIKERISSTDLKEDTILPTPWFGTSGLPTMREYISVVILHQVCVNVWQQPQDTNVPGFFPFILNSLISISNIKVISVPLF